MVDYELLNRLEWDQDLQAQRNESAEDNDWTVAQGTRSQPAPARSQHTPKRQDQPLKTSRSAVTPAKQNRHSRTATIAKSRAASSGRWRATNFQKLIKKPARRAPEQLTSETGTSGEAEWRTGTVGPIDHVKIPEDLCLQDKYYEQIAKEHDTFVFPDHKHGSGGSRTFGIWGDREQALKTREAIAGWIETVWGPRKANRAAAFAKTVSLTPVLRSIAEKQWAREMRKARYRQHPPPGMVFHAIGDFHWPSQEYRPDEILGASFEALDPIRMDCSCYVVYYNTRNAFRVMGKAEDVQKGLDRIRMALFQVAARQVTGPRKYLLRWPESSEMPAKVALNAYDFPSATASEAPEARTGKTPRGTDYEEDEDFALQSSIQSDINCAKAKTCVLKTIPKLHYYRGNLQLRLRLGTFLVDQYKKTADGKYSLSEYEHMVRESQFVAHVTRELGDKHVEHLLLEKLHKATDLLTPMDNMVSDLTAVAPVIGATFTFADQQGDLRLSQEWQLGYDSDDFDRCSQKWSRLDRESATSRSLLDVSLTDLRSGRAWQIDLLASHAVYDTRLPKVLSRFAPSVKIIPPVAKARAVDRPFVTYNPFTSLKSIQQRISYRYAISGTDYTLDLSCFQDKVFSSEKPTAGTTAEPMVYETRWCVQVYRTAWDTIFAQNESLAVGASATWDDDVATWFPLDIGPGIDSPDDGEDGDQGWDQLLEKLEKIEQIVKEAQTSLGDSPVARMRET